MRSVFLASDYRSYLRSWIRGQKASHGLKTKIAESIGCQNSHLTRVLKEEIHLTPDQAFALCEFWKMSEAESEYFLRLVDHDRSGSHKFRDRLKRQLNQMRLAQEDLAKRFQDERLGQQEREMTYYSSWHWSAVHVATMIPKLQTVTAIAQRLSLDESLIRETLRVLEVYGLVKSQHERWLPTSKFLHLPATSPMQSVQHGNWRTRAVLNSQGAKAESLHYTIVQSVANRDFALIKDLLLETIDRYRKISDPSPEEDLICFACDLFRI